MDKTKVLEGQLAMAQEQMLKVVYLNDELRAHIDLLNRRIRSMEANKAQMHGLSGYSRGCRCEKCRVVYETYQAGYRLMSKKGKFSSHLNKLMGELEVATS